MATLISLLKNNLEHNVRTHMNTEAGTAEEIRLMTTLDLEVNELLRLGVSEIEIREIIQRAQVYDPSRPIPPFPTRRYATPSQLEEITRMREASRYRTLEDGTNTAPPAPSTPPPSQSVKPFNPEENYSSLLECKVCYTNIKDIRLNCGHMVCAECANRVQICPQCRAPISRRDKVYYNKYLKYKTKYFQLKNEMKKL